MNGGRSPSGARYSAGGYGKADAVDSGFEAFARLVERLAETAEAAESRR